MRDAGTLYAEARARIAELARTLDDEQLATPVAACPGWSVRDLLAHLAAVPADVAAGNLDGAGSDAWTRAQVDARRDRSVDELLAEWDEHGPALEARLREQGPGPLLFDVVCHEQDLCNALRVAGRREETGVELTLDRGLAVLGSRIAKAGLPALEVRAGGRVQIAGEGEPGAILEVAPYDLFRAISGRRSEAQIRAFDWTGDPEPYLPVFAFLPMAAADVDDG